MSGPEYKRFKVKLYCEDAVYVCVCACMCLSVTTITKKLSKFNVLLRTFVGLMDITQGQIDSILVKVR